MFLLILLMPCMFCLAEQKLTARKYFTSELFEKLPDGSFKPLDLQDAFNHFSEGSQGEYYHKIFEGELPWRHPKRTFKEVGYEKISDLPGPTRDRAYDLFLESRIELGDIWAFLEYQEKHQDFLKGSSLEDLKKLMNALGIKEKNEWPLIDPFRQSVLKALKFEKSFLLESLKSAKNAEGIRKLVDMYIANPEKVSLDVLEELVSNQELVESVTGDQWVKLIVSLLKQGSEKISEIHSNEATFNGLFNNQIIAEKVRGSKLKNAIIQGWKKILDADMNVWVALMESKISWALPDEKIFGMVVRLNDKKGLGSNILYLTDRLSQHHLVKAVESNRNGLYLINVARGLYRPRDPRVGYPQVKNAVNAEALKLRI